MTAELGANRGSPPNLFDGSCTAGSALVFGWKKLDRQSVYPPASPKQLFSFSPPHRQCQSINQCCVAEKASNGF